MLLLRLLGVLRKRFRRGLPVAVAGGVAGLLFLSTEFSVWGLIAGFAMGFTFLLLAALLLPDGEDAFLNRLAGAIAGGVAACLGWWVHEGEASMAVWMIIGVVLGAMLLPSLGEFMSEEGNA